MTFVVTQQGGSIRTVDASGFHLDGPLVVFTKAMVNVGAYPVSEIVSVDLLGAIFADEDPDADRLVCTVWQNEAHGPWMWEVREDVACDPTGYSPLAARLRLSDVGNSFGQEFTKAEAEEAADRFAGKVVARRRREAAQAEHRAATTETVTYPL